MSYLSDMQRRVSRLYRTNEDFVSEGGKQCNSFELTVYYVKGGYSFWDYHHYPSGYRVSYTPTESDRGGMVSFVVGDGFYEQKEEAERFNKKKLSEIAEEVFKDPAKWLSEHGLSRLNAIGYREA